MTADTTRMHDGRAVLQLLDVNGLNHIPRNYSQAFSTLYNLDYDIPQGADCSGEVRGALDSQMESDAVRLRLGDVATRTVFKEALQSALDCVGRASALTISLRHNLLGTALLVAELPPDLALVIAEAIQRTELLNAAFDDIFREVLAIQGKAREGGGDGETNC